MQSFTVNGVELRFPPNVLTRKIADKLRSGRYEGPESTALKNNLRPGDRFLDLGAGAGYLASIAAGIVGGAAVAGVEAVPEMVEAAQANLDRNGGAPGRILWGAVVPDDFAAPEIAFVARRAFWASSIAAPDPAPDETTIAVPALRLNALLAQHRPTVLSVDIEGGERALFDAPLPHDLRLVVMELHPGAYGPAGVKRIFDGLSASGLTYSTKGSHGATVVFERVAD